MQKCFTFLNIFVLGHEIIGFEKIPNKGPALIILYHGAIPVDMYYLLAKIVLYKDRTLHAVGDRFLFCIPGRYYENFLL